MHSEVVPVDNAPLAGSPAWRRTTGTGLQTFSASEAEKQGQDGDIYLSATDSEVGKIKLSANAWLIIRSAGACACCAMRLSGCQEPAVYAGGEPRLRARLDALLSEKASTDQAEDGFEPEAAAGNGKEGAPCLLCLGILQPQMHVRVCPRARPSSASRSRDERHLQSPASDVMSEGRGPTAGADVMRVNGANGAGAISESGQVAAAAAAAFAATNESDGQLDDEIQPAMCVAANTNGYRYCNLAAAIADCARGRGYTISAFNMNVAMPACLAVRHAAFMEVHGHLLPRPRGRGRNGGSDTDEEATTSVKEALKMSVQRALSAELGVAWDKGSDLVVEVSITAAEADADAAQLLGLPCGTRGGGGRLQQGRWARKRQRRENHSPTTLTAGAVKKALSTVSDETRDRMRQWLERASHSVAQGGSGVQLCGDDRLYAHKTHEPVRGSSRVEHDTEFGVPYGKRSGACQQTSTEAIKGAVACKEGITVRRAYCDVVVRRQPIHVWGRYTKLSRCVPQTPWMRGNFSVQEAVLEPFERFTGCVEGLLHAAGREDIDVRMLGNGRPFSLELVDCSRTSTEVEEALPSMAAAINAGAGSKNQGAGVLVRSLRMAGPGDKPSDVQRVGEGKRKHYRCVVWVSRAVTPQHLAAMCKRRELVIQQSTPLRVLHRRTLLDRARSICDLRTEWINAHFFVLDLVTSAGEGENTLVASLPVRIRVA